MRGPGSVKLPAHHETLEAVTMFDAPKYGWLSTN